MGVWSLRNPKNEIIDWLQFAYRNPSHVTKHARKQNSVRRAMALHRRENPYCYLTGSTKIAVHHIIPVSVDSDLAGDPGNFVSLHPQVHLQLAHAGSYTRYVPNIIELLDYLRDNMIIVVSKKTQTGGDNGRD